MSDEDVRTVQRLYRECPLTVDELPYTAEFDRLHAAFEGETGRGLDRHGFWRVLSGLRKARRLARKER